MTERVTLYLHPGCDHCKKLTQQWSADSVQRVVPNIVQHHNADAFPMHIKKRVPTLEVINGQQGELFFGLALVLNEIKRRMTALETDLARRRAEADAQARQNAEEEAQKALQEQNQIASATASLLGHDETVGGMCDIPQVPAEQYNDKKLTKAEVDALIRQRDADDEAYYKKLSAKISGGQNSSQTNNRHTVSIT
jgi:glutaredoxin